MVTTRLKPKGQRIQVNYTTLSHVYVQGRTCARYSLGVAGDDPGGVELVAREAHHLRPAQHHLLFRRIVQERPAATSPPANASIVRESSVRVHRVQLETTRTYTYQPRLVLEVSSSSSTAAAAAAAAFPWKKQPLPRAVVAGDDGSLAGYKRRACWPAAHGEGRSSLLIPPRSGGMDLIAFSCLAASGIVVSCCHRSLKALYFNLNLTN